MNLNLLLRYRIDLDINRTSVGKMKELINVFFPYYQCDDPERQLEIDTCLQNNARNKNINSLFVVIDDGCQCPVQEDIVEVINISGRLTYQRWLEMTKQKCKSGISILCNSDIYFDDTLPLVHQVLKDSNGFLALSRWEFLQGATQIHPNPHWSQDTWAVRVEDEVPSSLLSLLDFPMGVPRCDNKIAYLFSVYGWKVFNPVKNLRSIHMHESQMRTYDKKLDDRLLGGVAYVYPGEHLEDEADLDYDVWVKRTNKVKKVAINKSMEKWIAESNKEQQEKDKFTENVSIKLKPVTADFALNAFKSGTSLYKFNANFSTTSHGGHVLFNNGYEKGIGKSIPLDDYNKNPQLANVHGLIPTIVESYIAEVTDKPSTNDDVNFWQYPCATEFQAYHNHKNISPGEHVDAPNKVVNIYLPLPWATYIDKKVFPENYLVRVKSLLTYYKAISSENGFELRVHTVCQHIHWARILEVAQELGVTDLHLSHKNSKSEQKQQEVGTKLRLHGWMLIAVNYVTPERSKGMERKPVSEKKLLASFIGAHMPHYLDDSRVRLFEAAKESGRDDVFVDLGSEWHFNKVVYEEQVLNRKVNSEHLDEHQERTYRYNSILSDSKFSLCPVGAGPNTLRFWESIAVGSIPVVFSDDLSFFKECKVGAELLENCILWDRGFDDELFKHLSKFDNSELQRRSNELMNVYLQIEKLSSFLARQSLTKKKTFNILYVGASVTAQRNGYRPQLNELLSECDLNVSETVLATGATGSMFGLCNLSTLSCKPGENFDLAIYEYSTGDLNVGLTPVDRMEGVVSDSLRALRSISKDVVLLHNYRSDYEAEKGDFVRSVHNKAAKNVGVRVIDICPIFEALRIKVDPKDWHDYYRDNVHTGEKGSVVLASHLFDELGGKSYFFELIEKEGECKPPVSVVSSLISVAPASCEIETYTYPSSQQNFQFVTLRKGQQLSFDFVGELWGVVSIVGPTSGWVEVKADGVTIQKYSQLDAHCYYNRVQPRQFIRHFPVKASITIELIEGELDFSLVKESHIEHSADRELRVSYLMGSGARVSDIKLSEVGA